MLSELLRAFGGRRGDEGRDDPRIEGVALDSRRVRAGDLYAALPGATTDGARFVPQALERGARAVLAPAPIDAHAAPLWLHPGARGLVGLVAARVLGEPTGDMLVVGVTGTNGKTTVAHLVAQLLERAGRTVGVVGTTGHRLAGGRALPTAHTTPHAAELQRLAALHREHGGDALVLEVSSHALDQERTSGLRFDVAVFTNLGRDHLEYHGGLEAYAAAKARLFRGLDSNGVAVLNADDPWSAAMAAAAREARARVITVSTAPRKGGEGLPQRVHGAGVSADLTASGLRADLQGTHLALTGMGFSGVEVRLPLVGRFNASNAAVAAAAALMSGAGPSAVLEGLASVSPPPGRLEPVPAGERGFRVLVDYAHTAEALENVLATLRELLDAQGRGGRLLVVFGCGGERDRAKRAPMGAAAARLADVAVVTSDNPRSEDPAAIADEVVAGMDGGRARRVVELDRRAAIRAALAEARPGDVVLLAGKGHESVQQGAGAAVPFDDRAVAAEELAS